MNDAASSDPNARVPAGDATARPGASGGEPLNAVAGAPAHPTRRTAVLLALGATALAGGVGVALMNDRAGVQARKAAKNGLAAAESGASGSASKPSDGSDTAQTAVDAFWQASFDSPKGGSVKMQAFKGKPLLLNFWATWCPPCVEELPLIDAFYRQNAGKKWQVMGLAVDQLKAVNDFLSKAPVSFPVALAGMPGIALSKSLGNLGGGLPFTVVLGSSGGVLHRKMGRITPDDLKVWATLQ
jgi:thiol-disulfide isomerase/thioredoxin